MREHGKKKTNTFELLEVLHIEEDTLDGPDVAFLRVEQVGESGELAQPIELAERDPVEGVQIAALGYADWDGERNDELAMNELFGEVFGVKRLHPGEVMRSVEFHFDPRSVCAPKNK